MARARNIKPGFFRDADLVELPFEARLLFIGLWTVADREGRLEDKPKQIKLDIFPADNVDCDALLGVLAGIGVIERYTVGGKRYIQVTNFSKHQHPHKTECESTIPAPSGEGCGAEKTPEKMIAPAGEALEKMIATTGEAQRANDEILQQHQEVSAQVQGNNGASTVQERCNNGASTVQIRLIPDSINNIYTPPIVPPAEAEGTDAGAGSKRSRCSRSGPITFAAWLAKVKSAGQQPIAGADPIFAYADEAGLPEEFLLLAWAEFRRKYGEAQTRQSDWRAKFRNCVRGNWLRLWYATSDGSYALTTAGMQAQRAYEAAQAALEPDEAGQEVAA